MAQRCIDFGDGGLGQRDDPAAIADEIRGCPGAGVADRSGEDGRRRVAREARVFLSIAMAPFAKTPGSPLASIPAKLFDRWLGARHGSGAARDL
jgi:hypothetical protein